MDPPPDDLYADVDDEVYSCRKCNKILEEGRAFELGGSRWHVDCFRCSSCDNQLDCDANLLVLGNGDLICANCCYSCCVCNKKIDDLAILTGKDTAFCSKCFKCRNCKRPIENLRYARTSHGIFCMNCYDKLMERRKRSKAQRQVTPPQTIELPPPVDLAAPAAAVAAPGGRSTPGSARSTPQSLLDKTLPPVPIEQSPEIPFTPDAAAESSTLDASVSPTKTITADPDTAPATTTAEIPDTVEAASSPADERPLGDMIPLFPIPSPNSTRTQISVAQKHTSIAYSHASLQASDYASADEDVGDREPASYTQSDTLAVPADAHQSNTSASVSEDTPAPTATVMDSYDNKTPPQPNSTADGVTSAQEEPVSEHVSVKSTVTTPSSLLQPDLSHSVSSDTSASVTTSAGNGRPDSAAPSESEVILSKQPSTDDRASLSSASSSTAFASFSRQSKGFLSDLGSRRSSTSFASKVRRISRSITLDQQPQSSALGSAASVNTPTTATGAVGGYLPTARASTTSVGSEFSFPQRNTTDASTAGAGEEKLDVVNSMSPAFTGRMSPELSRSSARNSFASSHHSLDVETTATTDGSSKSALSVPKQRGHHAKRSISSGSFFNKAFARHGASNSTTPTMTTVASESTSTVDSALAPSSNTTVAVQQQQQQQQVPAMSQQQQQTIIRAAAAPVKETLVSSTSRFFSFGKKDDSSKRRISSSVSSATLAKDANSTTTLSSTQSAQSSNKTRNAPARPRTPKLGPKKKSASPVVHMATPPAQTGNGVSSGSRTLSTESPYIDLPENFVESTGFSLDEDFASILNNQKFASSPRSPGKAASARLQSLLRRRPSRATMRSFVTGSSPASSPRMQRQDGGSHNRQPSGSMLASSPPEGESLWTTSASSPLYRADIPNMPTELLDTVRILSSESGAGLDEPIDLDYADLTLTVDNSRRHRMAGWDDDGEDEITKLKYELARATQRIVELEAQAKSAHGSDDAANLDAKIEERRQTIASLEAQRTVMQTEVEVLQDHNPNTPKTHQATSSLADETEKLSRMKAELESAKKVLQTEIEELIAQRNGLLEENARLMTLRDAATVEAEHLNTKNLQLANMNNEITRQIQDKFKNNKASHSPAPSDSSAFSATGRGASRHKNEGSADYSPSMSSGKIPLFSRLKDASSASGVAPPSSTSNDEKARSPLVQSSGGPIVDEVPEVVVAEETVHLAKPITIISTSTSSSSPLTRNRSGSGSASNSSAPTMVHSISSRDINQGNNGGGGGGLKFWKRKRGPGAAVAKGFNKMFTNESGGHQGGVGGLQGFAYNSNGSMSSFEESEQHEQQNQQPQQQQYLQPPQQNSTGGLGISLPKSASAMSALNVMAGNGVNGKHSATSKLRGMAMKVSGNGGGGSSEELAEANGQPKLFGMDISERAAMEGRKIPMIITRCIEEVEVRGMDYEGIYRKSGIKSQITAIQLLFERAPSEVWDLSEAEMNQLVSEKPVEDKDKKLSQWDLVIRWYQELTEAMAQDICGVTSVLKQYLRYIPNPIITFDSYLAFVNLIDIDDVEGRIYSMTQIVKSLPSAHQRCLEVLVRHLARVVESSDKNLMTSRNLAVVFAPTLVRDYSGSREIMDANKKGIVVQFMIDHAQRVFGDEGLLV